MNHIVSIQWVRSSHMSIIHAILLHVMGLKLGIRVLDIFLSICSFLSSPVHTTPYIGCVVGRQCHGQGL
jgi:hypothetical protein